MNTLMVLVGLLLAQDRPEKAHQLYDDAVAERKAARYEQAAALAEKCIEATPTYAPCYKIAGSTFAALAGRDQSEVFRQKAIRYYRRFLELAPDDAAAPMVKKLLAEARP